MQLTCSAPPSCKNEMAHYFSHVARWTLKGNSSSPVILTQRWTLKPKKRGLKAASLTSSKWSSEFLSDFLCPRLHPLWLLQRTLYSTELLWDSCNFLKPTIQHRSQLHPIIGLISLLVVEKSFHVILLGGHFQLRWPHLVAHTTPIGLGWPATQNWDRDSPAKLTN